MNSAAPLSLNLPSKPVHPFAPRNVAVLMGGFWSLERNVSLESGSGVCTALEELGHRVTAIDPSPHLGSFVQQIETAFTCPDGTPHPPDVIFNILHGPGGEDGLVQGVLEWLKIPYTFSGILGSSLSMDKAKACSVAQGAGIRCPLGQVMSIDQYRTENFDIFPHVIKPLNIGSSVGVKYVDSADAGREAALHWNHGSDILVEQYIPGREIHVAVLGKKALGAIELSFSGPIFSYHKKYTQGQARHLMPAPIPLTVYQQALEASEMMHHSLGCRGLTRSDFRYDDTQSEPGTLYYLETNTQPGFTPLSLCPEIAAYNGWTYNDLVQWVLEDASCDR